METPTPDEARRERPSRFVPRAVLEAILREAPLDQQFEADIRDALDDRIDEL
jgi:predicted ABC-class ATPase